MPKELSRNERIKEASRYLRGALAEGLAQEITGAIAEEDQQLVKFHGIYLQDDLDLRAERRRKKLEAAFAFMIRVRIPGGVLTPSQYLALGEIGRLYAGNTMRITTRQTIQLHGVIKSNLKATLAHIDAALLTTIAACGDVNRNVICNPNPHQSHVHAAVLETARALSGHLLPRTPLIGRFGSTERRSQADTKGDRTFFGIDFDAVRAKRHDILGRFDRCFQTDIANFYPSIYTHSIPWALLGKQKCKAEINTPLFKGHYANKLDIFTRNMQDRQTIGIPIGPETSRILAEIISVAIDIKLQADLGLEPRLSWDRRWSPARRRIIRPGRSG
jgi:Nitrite/Sulfite reductase ferredoxin-like half domain